MIRALGTDIPNAVGYIDSETVQRDNAYDQWFHVAEWDDPETIELDEV